ncbi:neutral/alkaline ceramidase [Gordonia sp. (in: high G+C Gram-positive bacteria)]|uniref:neutral/alkaline ceramidase n=1 Tax=Gordonia sp. (in: high G+C Gram-positive bacteria) TaxID=84139 RepID=UPI002FDAA729
MDVSRRTVIAGTAAGAVAAGTFSALGPAPAAATSDGYLVGCGRADMTGAIAGQGMMGYSDTEQVTQGLRQRCWARAYVIVDASTGERVVFVNADIACIFQSHHMGLMPRLRKRFGGLYAERNVNLNATHNHNSCGGTAWDFAYSIAAFGFKKNSYEAEVDGLFRAIVAAHDNLAPGTVSIGRGELHNASRNRSRGAFDLNPKADRAHFPNAIDPQVTVLRLRQGGNDIGAITWFPTHGTSLTDANRLISADNKGYASYLWEQDQPGVIASFPQTNAGDMTPNLNLIKMRPSGPTDDHTRNCEIIGRRQYDAGRAAFSRSTPMGRGGVDAVIRYVDMSAVRVSGDFTPDGRPAATTPAMFGASAAATSTEDNTRSQLAFLQEGAKNPLVHRFGATSEPSIAPWIRDMQSPKLILVPLGLLPPSPWVPHVVPLQIMRIGQLVLVAVPAEMTIVAGLRLRKVVADAMRVAVDDVLIQGYSNAYTQYVTTPEEYDAQQYEGGETMYGRYTLPAYLQEFDALGSALRSGRDLGRGPAPLDKSGFQPDLLPPVPSDRPVAGHRFGDVLTPPRAAYRTGRTVTVRFVGAHPNNDFHTGGTYLDVQRADGPEWVTVADDNDWSTTLRWARPGGSTDTSVITVEWTIPDDAAGRYRIRYHGDWRAASGKLTPFTGTTRTFVVR